MAQHSEPAPSLLCADRLPPLQVNRPLLPTFDRLAHYAAEIDAARYYTNFGRMHERLRHRLADHFGLDEAQTGLASSGTAALVGLLLATSGVARPGRHLCVCPSFTFVATAAAAKACGYTPYFADIEPLTWELDPERVEQLPNFDQVGAVIVVAALGRMVDLTPWQAFSDRTGVSVVVDAAACFGTIDTDVRAVRLPVMVSLHATKTFSTGEGGLMLCSDTETMCHAVSALNFGFDGERISMGPSTNGKMSEYHAIVGLADLDDWATKKNGFVQAAECYAKFAKSRGLGSRIIVDSTHAVSYAHFLAHDASEAARATDALDAELIEWRRWYGMGLHLQPAFRDCPAVELSETERLTARLIGLPMSVDIEAKSIMRVLDVLRRVVRDE